MPPTPQDILLLVETLQSKLDALGRTVQDQAQQIELLSQAPESQLTYPLDPVTQNLIHENSLLMQGPFVAGSPTLNGYIPMLLNGTLYKVATVS